jgi:hypothetical protein
VGESDLRGGENSGHRTTIGRWWRRSTVRSLRKELEQPDVDFSETWDVRENTETRLPDGESVHFGGLVLTEAFTPSTVASLFKTLRAWPTERPGEREERVRELARSRGGRRGGWQNLGYVRPPGTFTLGGPGSHDAALPAGVDAVWIRVSYITPSLAMVVATFTLAEESGDLSPILRADYRTRQDGPYFAVYGRFGRLRAHIPWARPTRYRAGANTSMAEDQKRQACDTLIRGLETACARWFYGKFSGRFAAARKEERPVIRMIFTKDEAPYSDRHKWLRPLGLDFAFPLWRSDEAPGWWLSRERSSRPEERDVLTLAARRADAAEPQGDSEPGTSNWALTQRFGTHRAELAALHALPALLSIYADRLARLRDRTRDRRRPRRPVREGLALDDYLIGDGLDAATVASDLGAYTEDLDHFRWGVPEFTEYMDHMPEQSSVHRREPREYVPVLRESIRGQASRVANDSSVTTEAVKASAELRQAISNTRLGRLTLLLSGLAAAIAIVSLLVSSH